MPNLTYIQEELRMPGFVPHIYSAQVLVYNPDNVKEPPQTFGDLLDPKWKGKIGMVSTVAQWVMCAASLYETGKTNDFDKAKEFMLKLNANGLRLYPETDALAPAFKSGEIDVGVIWLARTFMWQNSNFPVKGNYPEGRRHSLCLGHGDAEERAGQGSRLQIHECIAGAVGAARFRRAHGLSADGQQCHAFGQGWRPARVSDPKPKLVTADYAVLSKAAPDLNDWWLKNIQHS